MLVTHKPVSVMKSDVNKVQITTSRDRPVKFDNTEVLANLDLKLLSH